MYYIFEMANNHQGSVEHARLIIDNFSELSRIKKFKCCNKVSV